MNIQGDTEDPEGQGKADSSGNRGGGRDLEDHSGNGATEDKGGAFGRRRKEEPDRARGTD